MGPDRVPDDVLAKVAFLLGSVQELAMLERFGAEGIGVRRDSHSVATRRLGSLLE